MNPCDFVLLDGFSLPGVNGISTAYEPLVDAHRTLSGRLRVDRLAGIGTKRTWQVPLNRLTPAERTMVLNIITGNPGIRDFVIDSVGSIQGTIRVTSDVRVPQQFMRASGPAFWADGTPKLWADGTRAEWAADYGTFYWTHGGGNLAVVIEEA